MFRHIDSEDHSKCVNMEQYGWCYMAEWLEEVKSV
jgi:hypothetical protein